MLIRDRHTRVIHAVTGELLRDLTLDTQPRLPRTTTARTLMQVRAVADVLRHHVAGWLAGGLVTQRSGPGEGRGVREAVTPNCSKCSHGEVLTWGNVARLSRSDFQANGPAGRRARRCARCL